MNVDTADIIQELKNLNTRLSNAYKEMYKQAESYSQSEKTYKIANRQKILML